jgi:hypothetical protein
MVDVTELAFFLFAHAIHKATAKVPAAEIASIHSGAWDMLPSYYTEQRQGKPWHQAGVPPRLDCLPGSSPPRVGVLL